MNFRWSTIMALLMLAAFHFLTYSYPFLSNTVPTYTSNATLALIANATNVTDASSSSPSSMVGCNLDKFNWCTSLTQVNNPYIGFHY